MSSTNALMTMETIDLTDEKNNLFNLDFSILLEMEERLRELEATEMAASSRKLMSDIIAMQSTNVKQQVDVLRTKKLVQTLINHLQSFKNQGYYVHDEIQLWHILLHMIEYTVVKPTARANELVGETPLESYIEFIDTCVKANDTKLALKSISGIIAKLLKARCCNQGRVPTTVKPELESFPDRNSTMSDLIDKDEEEEEKIENATRRIKNMTMSPTNSAHRNNEVSTHSKPPEHRVSYMKLTSRLNKLVIDASKNPSATNGGEVDASVLADQFFDRYSSDQGYIKFTFIDGKIGHLTKDSLKNRLKIKLDDVQKYGRVPLFKKTTLRFSGGKSKTVVPLNFHKQLHSVAFLEFRRDIISRKDLRRKNDVTDLKKKYAFRSWQTATKRWYESTDEQVITAYTKILEGQQKNKQSKKMMTTTAKSAQNHLEFGHKKEGFQS